MATGESRLRDKVVLVTGATGGIGVEIVRRLAAEDAAVVVTDLGESACAELVVGLARPDRHLTR
ncbi:MAG: SDR family NAD(P)-dependent oxidoreductase, partial [Nocardia sp.]|nr:SDR family NAD(P)-dependent oxidoreductase [Nocardia sp.]